MTQINTPELEAWNKHTQIWSLSLGMTVRKTPAPIKIKSALPSPPKTQNTPPPQTRNFMDMDIKLAQPFPAPELRTKNFTNTRIFLKFVAWNEHIQIWSLSLGMTAVWPQTGLCKFRRVWELAETPVSGKCFLTNFQGHGPYRFSLKIRHQGIGPYEYPLEIDMDQWLLNLSESSGLWSCLACSEFFVGWVFLTYGWSFVLEVVIWFALFCFLLIVAPPSGNWILAFSYGSHTVSRRDEPQVKRPQE